MNQQPPSPTGGTVKCNTHFMENIKKKSTIWSTVRENSLKSLKERKLMILLPSSEMQKHIIHQGPIFPLFTVIIRKNPFLMMVF